MEVRHLILAQQAREGNGSAFGELYTLYYRELYAYARFVLGAAQPAQDAVQEAALAAFAQVGNLRDAAAFKHWLFRILANICRRQLSARAAEEPAVSLDETEITLSSHEIDLTLALELRQALSALQEDEREIVLLGVLGGYSSREIASALRCPANTVRSKRKRALEKLRNALDLD